MLDGAGVVLGVDGLVSLLAPSVLLELDAAGLEDSALLVLLDLRESVMYQPLPLKTIPTGWITLRRAPPHCSQVVKGGSEKLWRFSTTSLQAVQV